MRKRLTDEEFDAISTLTRSTKLDTVFDVHIKRYNEAAFYDFEEDKWMPLKAGLELLYDSLAYPLVHEDLTKRQAELIVGLFKEFGIGDNDGYDWLLGPDEDGCEWVPEKTN